MDGRLDGVRAIRNELGDGGELDAVVSRLLPRVYDELRQLAGRFLEGERPDHTLQATALVHEAYARIAASSEREWDRAHFFRLAAKAMRHILVDHARRRAAGKRGGGKPPLLLTETALLVDDKHIEILEIEDALCRLSALSVERARVVELRYYGGCTIEEIADTLGISTATVERHWRFARAWLRAELLDEE